MPTALYHLQSPTTSVIIGGKLFELHSFIYSVKICSFHLVKHTVPIGSARHRGESAVGLPLGTRGRDLELKAMRSAPLRDLSKAVQQGCTEIASLQLGLAGFMHVITTCYKLLLF